MRPHAFAAGALLLIGTAASAASDPRISDRMYTANQIVTLHGKPGIESAIAFAADERIENIAVGNSAAWQVSPNKRANILFVKPATAKARTNMTVITDQHTYLFDLVSSAGGSPVYMLQFKYPDAPKPAAAPHAGTALAEAAPPPPRPRPVPVQLNFGWRGAGEKGLLPMSYFDDGNSTFLRWTKDMTLPAILMRGPDGTEGPVNYTVKGDYIVVEGIPAQILLRNGKKVATLTPVGLHPAAPASPASASAVPLQFQAAAGSIER